MTRSDNAGGRAVLWVGKEPFNGGGDEIFDRRLTDRLGAAYQVERLTFAPQPIGARIAALARGIPHPRYKFASGAMTNAFRKAAAQGGHVVVSWEALESLVWTTDAPVTLIVHNVISDILEQLYGEHPLFRLAARQSRRWERRTYRRANVRLVALSERDRGLLEALAPGKIVAVAPPGTPPLVPLARDQLIPEVALSGSYDWAPKRRDLLALAGEIGAAVLAGDALPGWRHDLPLPDVAEAAPLRNLSRAITSEDFGDGLRFGLIPDSFVGGFKLKSTFYIASNCVLLSRCDIRSEFAGLPHSAEFVRFTPRLSDIMQVMAEFEAAAAPELFTRWRAFQAACAARFSWQNSADVIAAEWR